MRKFSVLSVSLDKGLFDNKSDVFQRHLFYASCVNKYVVIVPTLNGEGKERVVAGNLTIIPTNSLNKWLYLPGAIRTGLKVRSEEFDLVTAQDPFLTGWAGVGIKCLLRIPLNVQIHSEFFNSKYFREESMQNRAFYFSGLVVLRFADSVRARNRRIKEDVLKRFPRLSGKVKYVPSQINSVFLQPLVGGERKYNLVLSGPRLDKQKNMPLLLRAFGNVRQQHPGLRLRIFGTGPEQRSLEKEALELGIENDVKFLGRVAPRELKELYEKASVFALPSNHEGWGLVCLEALARGTPVLMTNTGCAGEIVRHNETGYVVSIGDEAGFSQGLREILKNRERYLEMAVEGRKLVEKDCSRDYLKRQMLAMFRATCSA